MRTYSNERSIPGDLARGQDNDHCRESSPRGWSPRLFSWAALGALMGLPVAATAAPTIGPQPSVQPASCPSVTEKQCVTDGYLKSECGKLQAGYCKSLIESKLKQHNEAATAPVETMLQPNADQIPQNLKTGKFYGYSGPKAGDAQVVRGNHPIARTGMTKYVALQKVDPKVAAKAHRNPTWDQNGGQSVTSCAEYAYEQYYDWARFTDAAVACGLDYHCLMDVAFMPATPGIARRALKRKDGKPLVTQFDVKGVYTVPKNDMFSYGNFIYAGNGLGVPQTPELDAAKAALTAGKTWYKIGCPKNAVCPKAAFGSEWDYHQRLYENNKTLSRAEFEEYARRKAEFRRLVALHIAAAAVEAQALNKNSFRATIEPVLPFDEVTHDPFARIDFMRELESVRTQNADLNRNRLKVPIELLPGAGIENVGVKAQQQQGALDLPGYAPQAVPLGVLAAPSPTPTPQQGGMSKNPGYNLKDPCDPKTFTRGISELFGYGPLSCRIGEFLRAEYARKAAGQKSCLDLNDDDCDWSPEMFRARFMEGVPYIADQALAEIRCNDYMGGTFNPPAKNLTEAEAAIAAMKAAIDEAMQALQPYKGPGSLGKKFSDVKEGDEVYGDKKWFAGGYDYSLGWWVEPSKKTGVKNDGEVCELIGNAHGKVGVTGWIGGEDFSIVDGLVDGTVNENGSKKTRTIAHLNLMGKGVFDPINELWSQKVDKDLARDSYVIPPVKPSFTIMAGFVPITGALWAEVMYGVKLKLYGELSSKSCSKDDVTFGLHSTFTPYVGVDGRAQIGVGISGLLSAGIRGTINIITIGVPLDLDLAVRLKTIGDQVKATLFFDAQLSLTLATLAGRISAYIEFLVFEEEWELFSWSGIGPATIPLMEPLHAELPLTGMK